MATLLQLSAHRELGFAITATASAVTLSSKLARQK
jgi:hypothetical protein